MHLYQRPCRKSRIKAFKIARVWLESLESLIIKNNKDNIDVYIIHEIRDPRGIITSRRKDSRIAKKQIAAEARLLCHKMLEDIQARKRLSKIYNNTFMALKYEDLADAPMFVAKNIYNYIGEKLPVGVIGWIWENTHSEKDGDPFSEKRHNSSATSKAWMQILSKKEKSEITSECKELLQIAEYPL